MKILSILGIVILLWAVPVWADAVSPVGPPVLSGSWSQNWYWSGGVTDFEAFIVSGNNDFEFPIDVYLGGGGAETSGLYGPDGAWVSGLDGSYIEFTTYFTADPNETFQIDLVGLVGGQYYFYGFYWDAQGNWYGVAPFGDSLGDYDEFREPVPEPVSLVLFGTGLAGLALRKRRIKA